MWQSFGNHWGHNDEPFLGLFKTLHEKKKIQAKLWVGGIKMQIINIKVQ